MINTIFGAIKHIIKFGAIIATVDAIFPGKLNYVYNKIEPIITKQYEKMDNNNFMILTSLVKTMFHKYFVKNRNDATVLSKNKYILEYTLAGKQYYILIHKKSGPKTFIQAIDQDNNDITNSITKFAGPGCDFHNSKITPKMLGFQEIDFLLLSGENISFKENEIINIK
jgi:hypothetical protein